MMLMDGEARWEFHYLHTAAGPGPEHGHAERRLPPAADRGDQGRRRVAEDGHPRDKAAGRPGGAHVLRLHRARGRGADAVAAGGPGADREVRGGVRRDAGDLGREAGDAAVLRPGRHGPVAEAAADRERRAFDSPEGFPLAVTAEGEKSWFLAMGDSRGGEPQGVGAVPGPPLGGHRRGEGRGGGAGSGAGGAVAGAGGDRPAELRVRPGALRRHRLDVAVAVQGRRLLPPPVLGAGGEVGRVGPALAGDERGRDDPVRHPGAGVHRRAGRGGRRPHGGGREELPANALKAARVVRLPAEAGGREVPVGLVR